MTNWRARSTVSLLSAVSHMQGVSPITGRLKEAMNTTLLSSARRMTWCVKPPRYTHVPASRCLRVMSASRHSSSLAKPNSAPMVFDKLQTVTGRPGARFGPSAIRQASSESDFGYNIYTGTRSWPIVFPFATDMSTGRDAFFQRAMIVDCGDVPLTWQDKNTDFKMLDEAHKRISQKHPVGQSRSDSPRILTLGGDHATTISALRSTYRTWGKVSVVHIDTHLGERLRMTKTVQFADMFVVSLTWRQ